MAFAPTSGFHQNHETRVYVDLNGNKSLKDIKKADWAWLAKGITGVTPGNAEQADTQYYYDGGGYASEDVTGKTVSLTANGQRFTGDPAQDYIAKHQYSLGEDLKTLVRWINPDGREVVFVATMKGIASDGGNANAKRNFTVTLAANGMVANASGTFGENDYKLVYVNGEVIDFNTADSTTTDTGKTDTGNTTGGQQGQNNAGTADDAKADQSQAGGGH